ncbi:hypothetical protein A9R01_11005 ['Osedax' symbiont bacterium Rs2_46_30_T18]|nr:hypothetical protein A9R01_11005 ['Osedax' symbiont bacterium Rs2_46_30_T18]
MLNRCKQIFTALITLVILSGCAATTSQKQTGFLGNYDQFIDSKEYDYTKIYKAENFNRDSVAQLTDIKLEPFELWINTRSSDNFNPQQLAELASYFHGKMSSQLKANNYNLVDRASANSLTIRGAFSNIQFVAPELSATDFIPFRIVLNAGNAAYLNITDKKDVITTVSIEVEFLQGQPQQRVFALIATKHIDTTIANSGAENVKAVKALLDIWVYNFIHNITEIRAEKAM